MATVKITGQLYKVDAPVTTANGYTTQALVILLRNQSDPRYDDYITVELSGDKTALAASLQPGQIVEATCAIRGRKYNRRDTGAEAFFLTLSCYELTARSQHTAQQPQQPQQYQNPVVQGARPQQATYQQVMGGYAPQQAAPQYAAAPPADPELPF